MTNTNSTPAATAAIAAYRKGWDASSRPGGARDLDAASARFAQRNPALAGHEVHFAKGWADHASDYPFTPPVDGVAVEYVAPVEIAPGLYVITFPNSDGETIAVNDLTARAALDLADKVTPDLPEWAGPVAFFAQGDFDGALDYDRSDVERFAADELAVTAVASPGAFAPGEFEACECSASYRRAQGEPNAPHTPGCPAVEFEHEHDYNPAPGTEGDAYGPLVCACGEPAETPADSHRDLTAILRDGLAVAVVGNGAVLPWFLRQHSYSMDHALEHEGYSLETRRIEVNGWLAFNMYADRRGYGVSGSLARMAVEIVALVAAFEHNADTTAGGWRDYVAAPEIAAMLRAFVALLQFTDGGNNFDAIRGHLDAWARATAARIGEDFDA